MYYQLLNRYKNNSNVYYYGWRSISIAALVQHSLTSSFTQIRPPSCHSSNMSLIVILDLTLKITDGSGGCEVGLEWLVGVGSPTNEAVTLNNLKHVIHNYY